MTCNPKNALWLIPIRLLLLLCLLAVAITLHAQSDSLRTTNFHHEFALSGSGIGSAVFRRNSKTPDQHYYTQKYSGTFSTGNRLCYRQRVSLGIWGTFERRSGAWVKTGGGGWPEREIGTFKQNVFTVAIELRANRYLGRQRQYNIYEYIAYGRSYVNQVNRYDSSFLMHSMLMA